MKKIMILLAVMATTLFSSCTGPEGPVGPKGLEGLPGKDGLTPQVFEVANVNFDDNGKGVLKNFKSSIYSGDVVLVYRLAKIVDGLDVWSSVPESYYNDDGSLFFTYKFNFTKIDFEIYLKGFNLNTVPNSLKTNQVFRIVIVQADDGVNVKRSINKSDYSDYYEVIKKYNIDDSNVEKLN